MSLGHGIRSFFQSFRAIRVPKSSFTTGAITHVRLQQIPNGLHKYDHPGLRVYHCPHFSMKMIGLRKYILLEMVSYWMNIHGHRADANGNGSLI